MRKIDGDALIEKIEDNWCDHCDADNDDRCSECDIQGVLFMIDDAPIIEDQGGESK